VSLSLSSLPQGRAVLWRTLAPGFGPFGAAHSTQPSPPGLFHFGLQAGSCLWILGLSVKERQSALEDRFLGVVQEGNQIYVHLARH